ncbi:MAG: alpha/beta hydrolase-fold protein [Pseudomonadota bacterium]
MRAKAALFSSIVILLLGHCLANAAPKQEPWGEIEARTKFLRTKHYIESVRVHSEVYQSAKAKGGETVKGPFPVHVVLPENYEQDVAKRYGVIYLLGGKSGWDNGPEKGGATYWSVWCKIPLTMDNLKGGKLTKTDFQDNITDEELAMFNRWLADHPYEDLITVSLWNPGGGATGQYEKYLIDEVIPYIDSHYRTVPDRRFRGIDGACAGAAQAIMISARRPDMFAYVGGQQTDLGSYPMVPGVFEANISRIRKAGGIAYNINTNVRDGCNTYSNRGRLYDLTESMKHAGFPVTVYVFESCPHGYCAYRYPNGHQALYWFSQHFKKNMESLGLDRATLREVNPTGGDAPRVAAEGIPRPAPPEAVVEPASEEKIEQKTEERITAGDVRRLLPGLW